MATTSDMGSSRYDDLVKAFKEEVGSIITVNGVEYTINDAEVYGATLETVSIVFNCTSVKISDTGIRMHLEMIYTYEKDQG